MDIKFPCYIFKGGFIEFEKKGGGFYWPFDQRGTVLEHQVQSSSARQ
jgi:hypothetical protein